MGAPYSVLDIPGFLNGFAALMQHYNQERLGGEMAATLYLKHIADWFSVITPSGRLYRITSWPAVAIATLGAVSIAAEALRSSRLAHSLILLVFPFTYFWFI